MRPSLVSYEQHSYSTDASHTTATSSEGSSPKSFGSGSRDQSPKGTARALIDLEASLAPFGAFHHSLDTSFLTDHCASTNHHGDLHAQYDQTLWPADMAMLQVMGNVASPPVQYVTPSLMSTPNIQCQSDFSPVVADQQQFQSNVNQGQNPYAESNASSESSEQQQVQLLNSQGTNSQLQNLCDFSDASVFLGYANSNLCSDSNDKIAQDSTQQVDPSTFCTPQWISDLFDAAPIKNAALGLSSNDTTNCNYIINSCNIDPFDEAAWAPSAETPELFPAAAQQIQPQPQSPPGPSVPATSPSQRRHRRSSSRQRVSMTKKEVIKEMKESFGVPSWLLEGRRYQANMSFQILTTADMRRWREEGHRYFEGLEPIGRGDADFLRDLLRKFRGRRARIEREFGGYPTPERASVCEILIDFGVELTPQQVAGLASLEHRRDSV